MLKGKVSGGWSIEFHASLLSFIKFRLIYSSMVEKEVEVLQARLHGRTDLLSISGRLKANFSVYNKVDNPAIGEEALVHQSYFYGKLNRKPEKEFSRFLKVRFFTFSPASEPLLLCPLQLFLQLLLALSPFTFTN